MRRCFGTKVGFSQIPVTSRSSITAADVASFRSEGAICVKDVVSGETLASLQRAVRSVRSIPIPPHGDFDEPFEHRGGFNVPLMTLRHPTYKRFAESEAIRSIVKSFLGTEKINFLCDQTIIKDPHHPLPTEWHFDIDCWPFSGNDYVSIWTCLDQATTESGILYFMRGSHLNPISDTMPLFESTDPEAFNVMSIDTLDPGDAILFWGRTVHGAGGNSTNKTRRAISLRYIGDDIKLNPSTFGKLNKNFVNFSKGVIAGSLLN